MLWDAMPVNKGISEKTKQERLSQAWRWITPSIGKKFWGDI